MAKKIVDSNIWIAHFLANDPNHEKAYKILESLNFDEVYIHEYILLEVVTVLRLRAGAAVAAEALRMFHDLDLNKLDDSLVKSDLYNLLLQEKYPKLSYIDLFLLSFSPKGYEVLSFDKNLNRAIKEYAKKK